LIGKLGHGTEENLPSPCLIPGLESIRVQAISAGCEHSGVITEDGKLFTWGHGDGGRLGHGDNEPRTVPTQVIALEKMHARYE
jgi:alpha-tubulin suppressor-like RCC1 family protein